MLQSTRWSWQPVASNLPGTGIEKEKLRPPSPWSPLEQTALLQQYLGPIQPQLCPCYLALQRFPTSRCTFHLSANYPHQYPALNDANGSSTAEFKRAGIDEYRDLWEHQESVWLLAHSPAIHEFRRDHQIIQPDLLYITGHYISPSHPCNQANKYVSGTTNCYSLQYCQPEQMQYFFLKGYQVVASVLQPVVEDSFKKRGMRKYSDQCRLVKAAVYRTNIFD